MFAQPAPNMVMAGRVLAIHGSGQLVIEVVPVRVRREDQPHLPSTRPMLHISLAPDGRGDIRVRLSIDEPLQAIALRKPFDQALSMLPGAVSEMCGNASVERAVRPIGNYVNLGTFHLGLISWMAGTRPGHDGREAAIEPTATARLKFAVHV